MQTAPLLADSAIMLYFGLGVFAIVVSGLMLYLNMSTLLDAAFGGASRLSASANRLLLTGYGFLLGGYLVLSLPTGAGDWVYAGVFDFLRWKLGTLAIALGIGYFGGLVACSFVCGSALQRTAAMAEGVERKAA